MKEILPAVLFINSILDLRKREISAVLTIGAMVPGFAALLLDPMQSTMRGQLFYSLQPGIWLLILALYGCCHGGEGILGGGDALVILLLGFYMELPDLLHLLALSFGSAGIVGAIEQIVSGGKHRSLAFVPFLLAGYLWMEM